VSASLRSSRHCLKIRCQIIAYSVTDNFDINSTVNGSAGECNPDIVGLPLDSRGFKFSRRYRCRVNVCPTVQLKGTQRFFGQHAKDKGVSCRLRNERKTM
jgi:hypothetical protein